VRAWLDVALIKLDAFAFSPSTRKEEGGRGGKGEEGEAQVESRGRGQGRLRRREREPMGASGAPMRGRASRVVTSACEKGAEGGGDSSLNLSYGLGEGGVRRSVSSGKSHWLGFAEFSVILPFVSLRYDGHCGRLCSGVPALSEVVHHLLFFRSSRPLNLISSTYFTLNFRNNPDVTCIPILRLIPRFIIVNTSLYVYNALDLLEKGETHMLTSLCKASCSPNITL